MESSAQIRFRHKVFSVTVFGLIWFMLMNDYANWLDECVASYAIVSALYLFVICTSLIYWSRTGRVSSVFKWLVALMAGGFINAAIQLYARWLRVVGINAQYDLFMDSEAWHYRYMPIMIALSYIFALILGRVLLGDREETGQ